MAQLTAVPLESIKRSLKRRLTNYSIKCGSLTFDCEITLSFLAMADSFFLSIFAGFLVAETI